MSHWTIEKDGRVYNIPREIEILDPAERGVAVDAIIAAAEAKAEKAEQLFGGIVRADG